MDISEPTPLLNSNAPRVAALSTFKPLKNAIDLNDYLQMANISSKRESSSHITSDGVEIPIILNPTAISGVKDRSRSTSNFLLPTLNLAAFHSAGGIESIEDLATMVASFVSS
jgi:hypothetical protein